MSFYESVRENNNSLLINFGKNNFPSHFHKNLEFLYCLDTNLNVVIDNKNLYLNKNQLLVIDSYTVHHIIGKEHSISIVIPIIFLNDFFTIKKDKKFENIIIEDKNEIIKNILIKINEEKNENILIKKGLINYFIGTVLNRIKLIENKDKKEVLIIEIIKYINEKYMNPINLTNIADHFNYNKYTISHYFKKHTGINLKQYINDVRLNNCIEQIQSYTDFNITNIILNCGFESSQTFYRNFKRRYNITPIQMKKSN